MNKKAQGLTMNFIIIAAIALLILMILAIVFIQQMGKTTNYIKERTTTNNCVTNDDCNHQTEQCTNGQCTPWDPLEQYE